MLRKTEDENWVLEGELVWEIMFRFINWEVSIAEPEQRAVRDIPEHYKIWKHLSNCIRACRKINKQIEPHAKRSDSNGYHPLLPIAHLFTRDD